MNDTIGLKNPIRWVLLSWPIRRGNKLMPFQRPSVDWQRIFYIGLAEGGGNVGKWIRKNLLGHYSMSLRL
jgi:hypothetical protein